MVDVDGGFLRERERLGGCDCEWAFSFGGVRGLAGEGGDLVGEGGGIQ